MSVILAIDTAAPRLQLALLRADGAVDISIDEISKGHAESLFPAIGALLAHNGLAYKDLSRIAVTTGPGSFTGLRIGISGARGLALALRIPVIGVSSLLALSLAGPEGTESVVLLDARRNQAYFQGFSAPGMPIGGPALMAMADAQTQAQAAAPAPVLTTPFPDIARLIKFAADLDPALYPPVPDYLRDADAKPQEKGRVARLRTS